MMASCIGWPLTGDPTAISYLISVGDTDEPPYPDKMQAAYDVRFSEWWAAADPPWRAHHGKCQGHLRDRAGACGSPSLCTPAEGHALWMQARLETRPPVAASPSERQLPAATFVLSGAYRYAHLAVSELCALGTAFDSLPVQQYHNSVQTHPSSLLFCTAKRQRKAAPDGAAPAIGDLLSQPPQIPLPQT